MGDQRPEPEKYFPKLPRSRLNVRHNKVVCASVSCGSALATYDEHRPFFFDYSLGPIHFNREWRTDGDGVWRLTSYARTQRKAVVRGDAPAFRKRHSTLRSMPPDADVVASQRANPGVRCQAVCGACGLLQVIDADALRGTAPMHASS